MTRTLFAMTAVCTALPALAQPPSIPPQRIEGPELDLVPVEPAEAFDLPAGFAFDQVASMEIDARGHLYVLHRGPDPFLEFGPEGRLVRSFGGDIVFVRAHGLHIDDDGNFWVTDVSAHVVMKLDSQGQVLMTLGTAGEAGEWDEAAGTRLFAQPNDVAIGPNGDIFVAQGHTAAEPRILKFDAAGRFIKSWGGLGSEPGQFAAAHALFIGADGLLYVGDRENRRIQVFDLDGEFVKGWLYKGMACALYPVDDGHIYMATGFDGQIVELDMNGRVLGVIGQPGDGLGEFGEAHDLVVAPTGDVFVADVVNRRVQKFVRRR